MNECPAIGARVRYVPPRGCHRKGAVTGTVRAIYREYNARGQLLPEREWSVAVQVDALPAWWAYVGTDRFAPSVKELRAERAE